MRSELPDGYQASESYELSWLEFAGLNVLAVALAAGTLALLGWLGEGTSGIAGARMGTVLAGFLEAAVAEEVSGWVAAGVVVVLLVAAMIPVILVHEAIHGLLVWAFTGTTPHVGWSWSFAYCGQRPGTFLTRNQFLVVAIAPFAILTLAGVVALAALPPVVVPLAKVLLVTHSAGCAADVWGAGWLLTRSSRTFVWNGGLAAILYDVAE